MASVSSLSDSGAPSQADDAFTKRFDLPPTGSGPLDGLTFAAKDLIDIAGYVTGCGNPTWAKTHGPAVEHAICVQLLLNAGARCLGKTITDEFAFSLVGENHFYGTPRNARAPDRIPGGSSAGSASAVAAGEVDFALGTDTAGSVRVPAASCGLYGLRPTWGRLPMAGTQPLAPSFDTLGAFARTPDVLRRVAGVLYPSDELPVPVATVLVLEEGWELVDENVRAQLPAFLARLEKIGLRLEQVRLAQLAGGELGQDIAAWKRTFSAAQWPEVRSVYAGWLQHAAPRIGPRIADNFALTETLDRSRLAEGLRLRATARHQLRAFLQPGQVLCLPAIPCPPPLRGQVDYDRTGHGYLARTLCLTAFGGLAGLPQLVLPADTSDGLPMGFSFLGVADSERALISVAEKLHQK